MASEIRFYTTELREGHVFPCNEGDLREVLRLLPEDDLVGLTAVGLAMPQSKRSQANAAYFAEPKPRIVVYAYPQDLSTAQPRFVDVHSAHRLFATELEFGMEIVLDCGRITTVWSEKNLRAFILVHVLAHEVGHHVYRHRMRRTLTPPWRDSRESEKFAEHYARRLYDRVLGAIG